MCVYPPCNILGYDSSEGGIYYPALSKDSKMHHTHYLYLIWTATYLHPDALYRYMCNTGAEDFRVIKCRKASTFRVLGLTLFSWPWLHYCTVLSCVPQGAETRKRS